MKLTDAERMLVRANALTRHAPRTKAFGEGVRPITETD